MNLPSSKYYTLSNEHIIYSSFHIDPATLQIFKAGKEVFTAWYQIATSMEQAKAIIDASDAKGVQQMQRRPDLGRAFRTMCELENGAQAAADFEQWVEDEAYAENERRSGE